MHLEKLREAGHDKINKRDSRTITCASKLTRRTLNPLLKYASLSYACALSPRRASARPMKSANQ